FPLTGTTTIKAIGTKPGLIGSDLLTVTYTYNPPASVTKAWYLDTDGDGSIDKAIVVFDKALPSLPKGLNFSIVDQNATPDTKNVGPASMAFDGSNNRVVVTFAPPFKDRMTSITNSGQSGSTVADDAIPLAAGTFAVDDSVAPIIV